MKMFQSPVESLPALFDLSGTCGHEVADLIGFGETNQVGSLASELGVCGIPVLGREDVSPVGGPFDEREAGAVPVFTDKGGAEAEVDLAETREDLAKYFGNMEWIWLIGDDGVSVVGVAGVAAAAAVAVAVVVVVVVVDEERGSG